MALWTDNPTIASPYKSDLSEDEKVAGLSKFWSEARFNFPFFDRVPGLDWDRLYMEYLPQVRAAQTTAEYYRVLMRFAAALHDGHTEVHPPDELREVFYSSVPLETALVEDKVLITTVYDPALEAEGAQVGTQIVSINEQPVREYAEHFVAAYASGSTSQDRETRTYGYMLLQGPKSEAVRLVVQDVAGEKKSISAHRYCEPTSKCQWSGHEPVEFKILPEGIAYLAVREFVDDHCPKMMVDNFAAISQAKALIVDVRRNYGGNQMNAMAILRMLTDKSFDNVTVRELNYLPGERAQGYAPGWKKYPAFEERPDPDHHFSKPVVVLADQTSFSAAENFVVVFDSMHRGAIVGSTTPGSTGDSVIFKLPGGGNARIMMADVEYPDGRLFEGIGVTPHVKVSPTVSDIRQGRDEVLERAIEILQSGRATQ
jgi:C-terminal processing protease CtpA/Prc